MLLATALQRPRKATSVWCRGRRSAAALLSQKEGGAASGRGRAPWGLVLPPQEGGRIFLPRKRNSPFFPLSSPTTTVPWGSLTQPSVTLARAVGVPWGAVLLQWLEPWGAGSWSPRGPCSCISGPAEALWGWRPRDLLGALGVRSRGAVTQWHLPGEVGAHIPPSGSCAWLLQPNPIPDDICPERDGKGAARGLRPRPDPSVPASVCLDSGPQQREQNEPCHLSSHSVQPAFSKHLSGTKGSWQALHLHSERVPRFRGSVLGT